MKKAVVLLLIVVTGVTFADSENQALDYSAIRAYSSTLYDVAKQYEKEVGRPFTNYDEMDAAMKTERFQKLLKAAEADFCALPQNDSSLACIRRFGGVGQKG